MTFVEDDSLTKACCCELICMLMPISTSTQFSAPDMSLQQPTQSRLMRSGKFASLGTLFYAQAIRWQEGIVKFDVTSSWR